MAGGRRHSNVASVALHDLLADRQPYARTWIIDLRMEPLEDNKDSLRILWVHAYAVVLHTEKPLALSPLDPYVHLRLLLTMKLDGVADEVLE